MSQLRNNRIAIVGPTDTVSGFRALGVEAFPAHTGEELLQQLQTIKARTVDDDLPVVYAVVCVIEDLLADVDEAAYARAVEGPLPAVVLLPGPSGSQGKAEARLRRLAEQAVGSAII